jgi:hypothetical protein
MVVLDQFAPIGIQMILYQPDSSHRGAGAANPFGRAFYVAEQGGTAIAEASEASHVIRFGMNLSGQSVLDLTDPAVAGEWD